MVTGKSAVDFDVRGRDADYYSDDYDDEYDSDDSSDYDPYYDYSDSEEETDVPEFKYSFSVHPIVSDDDDEYYKSSRKYDHYENNLLGDSKRKSSKKKDKSSSNYFIDDEPYYAPAHHHDRGYHREELQWSISPATAYEDIDDFFDSKLYHSHKKIAHAIPYDFEEE